MNDAQNHDSQQGPDALDAKNKPRRQPNEQASRLTMEGSGIVVRNIGVAAARTSPSRFRNGSKVPKLSDQVFGVDAIPIKPSSFTAAPREIQPATVEEMSTYW